MCLVTEAARRKYTQNIPFLSVMCTGTLLLQKEIYPQKSLPNLRQLIFCRLLRWAPRERAASCSTQKHRRRPPVPGARCHSVGSGPESRDAGVSRFGESGSHLAGAGAAESHAGQVDGPGSSGNAGIGSHLAGAGAAESHAGHADIPGSSRNDGNGSHLAATGFSNGQEAVL